MYFEKFPYTLYTLDDQKTIQVIQNLLLRVVMSEQIKNDYGYFDEYDIKDGESPEILADKIYGSSGFHWVILHYNDIIDPRFEWPLSVNNLVEYCKAKYDDVDGVHHYEDPRGYTVNADYPFATPVTNFIYEDRLNEERRRIKLLKPQYLEAVVREFLNKIESANG